MLPTIDITCQYSLKCKKTYFYYFKQYKKLGQCSEEYF